MLIHERVIRGWLGSRMSRLGWGAVTLPGWRTNSVIIRYWSRYDVNVSAHEHSVHVEQLRRLWRKYPRTGGVRYLLAYAWLWCVGVWRYRNMRAAYDNHPMEQER